MLDTQTLIVTHSRPHIDDVAAIWLLKTYHPAYKAAAIDFLQKGDGEPPVPEGALAIGVGRGQFDEHKGDVGECATSLVWKWMLTQPEIELQPHTKKALERFVIWVQKEDLAELKKEAWWEWSVTVPIEYSFEVYHGDNQKVYALAALMFPAMISYYESVAGLEDDWEKRIEFESKWGKAIALESAGSGLSEKAWQAGAVMVIQINPVGGQRQFRAKQDSPVDFTGTYEIVHQREPEATWFLHHEKRMLLCGSRTASVFTPSNFTLQELVDLVKA